MSSTNTSRKSNNKPPPAGGGPPSARQSAKSVSIRPSGSSLKPYSARKLGDGKDDWGPGGPPGPSSRSKSKTGMLDTERFCGQVITIPEELPDILKLYAKGAMKTQPPDLLRWSGAYFRALANGETLPTKEKVEYPMRQSKDGLSPGILRVIDNQLGAKGGLKVETAQVLKRWRGFGLSVDAFNEVLGAGGMMGANVVEWDKLIAVMASTIGQNLTDTMAILCEVLTQQAEGTEPTINYATWITLYSYLGVVVLKLVDSEKVRAVDAFLSPIAKENSGLLGPKDFTSASFRLY